MARLGNITFACQDPDRLADFWAAALGYTKQEAPPAVLEAIERGELEPNEAAAAVDPVGRGPRLFFLRKAKSETTSIPLHLDLSAEDRPAEVERLVALGATVVEEKERTVGDFSEAWTVLKDPEGNGFCVCRSG